jgi:copper(I)-binding protein
VILSRCPAPLRGIALLAAAALVPAIAGCEAGINAPTQQWHQPTPGASAAVGDSIRVNNMFVLGPVPGSSLSAGGSAGMFFAVANNGIPDRLVSISAPGVASSVKLPVGGVKLGNQQQVLLTGPAPQVVLENLSHALGGGQYVRVTLNFQNAGAKTISVPVMPWAQYFSSYSPAPAPVVAPSTTPSPAASPTPS